MALGDAPLFDAPAAQGCRTAPAQPCAILSVAGFFLAPKGQNVDRIVSGRVAVQEHVSGVPEGHHPLAQIRYFRERPANVGGVLQQQQVLLDGLASTPGGFRDLRDQNRRRSLSRTLSTPPLQAHLWSGKDFDPQRCHRAYARATRVTRSE